MKIRGIIFWAHLFAGVSAGFAILIMSLTGICLAFESQIIGWAERDLRNVQPVVPAAPRLGLDALVAGVREKNPGAEPSAITLNSDPSASIMVNLGREDMAYLDPYTGQIIGHGSSTRAWLQKIESWHRWLGVRLDNRATGRTITGAANLVFLFLAVSGLFLWWPRAWNSRVLRPSVWFVPSLRGRMRDWNWHNSIGFWCALPLIIVTLTGVIMSYQWANNLLYTLTGNQPPPANQSSQVRREDGPSRDARNSPAEKKHQLSTSLDLVLPIVVRYAPDWKTVTIRLPQRPDGPIVASIPQAGGRLSFARSQLTLDSQTGDVVKWEPFSGQNAGRRLRLWARFLHTGEAGGLIGQTIAAVAAGGGSLLVITGLMMACRRFFGKRARPIFQREVSTSANVP